MHYNLTITELLTYISKRQTKIFLFHLFRAHKCSRTCGSVVEKLLCVWIKNQVKRIARNEFITLQLNKNFPRWAPKWAPKGAQVVFIGERRATVFSRITPHALIYFSRLKVGGVYLRVGRNSANQKVLRFLVAKWARDRKLDLLSSSSDVILALGPTTGTGNEKQRTLGKSKGVFLWDDPDQDQWSEISRIMVDQMSRWILVQSGFIGSFDLPWSEITGPVSWHQTKI